MKRNLLNWLFASLAVVAAGLFCGTASGQRGGGQHSSQYAVGRAPSATAAAPAAADYAYGAIADATVEMILKVPANAEVWFNGVKTQPQTKSVRHFATPALEPGWNYSYDIRVHWTERSRPVEQTRRIFVRAGDRVTLNLTDVPRVAN